MKGPMKKEEDIKEQIPEGKKKQWEAFKDKIEKVKAMNGGPKRKDKFKKKMEELKKKMQDKKKTMQAMLQGSMQEDIKEQIPDGKKKEWEAFKDKIEKVKAMNGGPMRKDKFKKKMQDKKKTMQTMKGPMKKEEDIK